MRFIRIQNDVNITDRWTLSHAVGFVHSQSQRELSRRKSKTDS